MVFFSKGRDIHTCHRIHHMKIQYEILEKLVTYIRLCLCMSSTIQKPDHLKSGHSVRISNGSWKNGGHLSGFQIVGLLDFRSHSKSRPFPNQPLFDQSDPTCKWPMSNKMSSFLPSRIGENPRKASKRTNLFIREALDFLQAFQPSKVARQLTSHTHSHDTA